MKGLIDNKYSRDEVTAYFCKICKILAISQATVDKNKGE